MRVLLVCIAVLSAALAARTVFAQVHVTTIDSVQTVDLSGQSRINFDLPKPGTITAFANAIPGRLYVFYFANGNTTLTSDNASLGNRSAKITPAAGTSILFVGETPTHVRQVADGVTSQ